MKCTICGEEIILSPSAAKRAASPSNRSGMTAADYTRLFPTHTHCQLARNKELLSDLIARRQLSPGSVI